MLVPLKWLEEFVDHGLSAEELSRSLTMSGLEVDGIEERHKWRDHVLVAKVLETKPHPQADKLRLALVDYGEGQSEIVCGAPNCRQGLVTAMAVIGADLGEGMKIKKTKIRGVESVGMLCSARELGLSDDHSGILELDPELTIGARLTDALDLETRVMEISITPNRGDALSILGVARDVAAVTGKPLRLPEIRLGNFGAPMEGEVSVEIKDTNACPRYCARLVRDLKIAPSPLWMADRLSACGVRPISNLVDVTNYVLMELGQPLHAFDYRDMAQGHIEVRTAEDGEMFTTLDNQERKLQSGMLLICDAERPVGLAGVMGGLNSEVKDDTEKIIIESAFFDPISIRRTSKRLGLSTEASYRFEREIDRQGCARAADRAAQLMAQLGDGQVAEGIIDNYPTPYQPREIALSLAYTSKYLGLECGKKDVTQKLESLGIEVAPGPDEDTIVCLPPSYRPDLERPADLTEEVARITGYDNIPVRMPLTRMAAVPRAWRQKVRNNAKDLLAAWGMDEAVTYSFAQPKAIGQMGYGEDDPRRRVVKLMNPLSEELSALRTSLMPNLLEATKRNLDQRQEDVALFEIGKAFWDRPGEKQPFEPSRVTGVVCGLAQPASWWSGEKKVGLAHVRGAVEYLLAGLGIEEAAVVPDDAPPYLDGEAYGRVSAGGRELGELGLVSAACAGAFDLEKPAYLFDLDFDALVELAPEGKQFKHLPRFPAVMRDLAMLVDKGVRAGEVLASARELAAGKAKKWLESVELFDLYQGKPLAKDKKSLGIRFRYRNLERTLKEKEIIPAHEKLVKELLAKFRGEIRA